MLHNNNNLAVFLCCQNSWSYLPSTVGHNYFSVLRKPLYIVMTKVICC